MISITLTNTDAIQYLNDLKLKETVNLSTKLEEAENELDYTREKLDDNNTMITNLETTLSKLTTKYDKAMESIIAINPSTPEDKLAYAVAAIDKDIELDAELEPNPVQFKSAPTPRKQWTHAELAIIDYNMEQSAHLEARKLGNLAGKLTGRTLSAIRSQLNKMGITVKKGIMYKV